MKGLDHVTTLGHVLRLCPPVPQRVHLIGDLSGSRKQLCFQRCFVFGCPGCLVPNVGGFVSPSHLTDLILYNWKMLLKYSDDNIIVITIEVLNRDACVCKLPRLARSKTYRTCIDNIDRLVHSPFP